MILLIIQGGSSMAVAIVLEEFPAHTQYVPLAVLGYCLTRTNFLAPVWAAMSVMMKAYEHTPVQKLQDMLVSIMAGNTAVSQINTRLRPDLTLAAAWQRERFADQSQIALVLNRLRPEHIQQLRQGSQQLFRQHSQTLQHDYQTHWLLLDLDLTGLKASRHAEGSRKGYVSGKRNQYGRQVVRGSIPTYHETLWSQLYPGNQTGTATLKPSLTAIQAFLDLTQAQRLRTIVRTDAGLGTDENINWLLWRHYQVLMKGYSGTRAASLARHVAEADWVEDTTGTRWIACAPHPPRFARRSRVFVLRWRGKTKMFYGTLISTLPSLSPLATWHLYNGRGAVEIEIKADKSGLRLPKRRKQAFCAQEGLILLTDLAHNLVSWMHHWVLEDTAFAGFGAARIVDELFHLPGRVEMKDGQLQKVALLQSHPYAGSMQKILQNLLAFFGNP